MPISNVPSTVACIPSRHCECPDENHPIVKKSPTTVTLPPTSDSKTPFGGFGWQNGPGHTLASSLKPYGSVMWSISVTSYLAPCDRKTTGRTRPRSARWRWGKGRPRKSAARVSELAFLYLELLVARGQDHRRTRVAPTTMANRVTKTNNTARSIARATTVTTAPEAYQPEPVPRRGSSRTRKAYHAAGQRFVIVASTSPPRVPLSSPRSRAGRHGRSASSTGSEEPSEDERASQRNEQARRGTGHAIQQVAGGGADHGKEHKRALPSRTRWGKRCTTVSLERLRIVARRCARGALELRG